MRILLAAVAAAALIVFVLALRKPAPPPPSAACRDGKPLAGVYHPSRLKVKSRCEIATGVVERVKFEQYDGDVHIELRLDEDDRDLLSRGNDQVHGNLVVEVIPQDRSRVPIPIVGERVSVVGPWVDDTSHDWREIHPAWAISAGRLAPVTTEELRRVRLLLSGVEGVSGEDDG